MGAQVEQQASEVDESVTTSEQVVAQCAQKSSTWYAYLEGGVKEYNSRFAVSNAQKIQKFTVLPGDFSEKGGELTATLKLKRSVVEKMHLAAIDAIYRSSDTFVPYPGGHPRGRGRGGRGRRGRKVA